MQAREGQLCALLHRSLLRHVGSGIKSRVSPWLPGRAPWHSWLTCPLPCLNACIGLKHQPSICKHPYVISAASRGAADVVLLHSVSDLGRQQESWGRSLQHLPPCVMWAGHSGSLCLLFPLKWGAMALPCHLGALQGSKLQEREVLRQERQLQSYLREMHSC